MFDDLSKSVKAQLYERVSSPLLASFMLAWAVWNYRFILVVFSSMPVTEKISYIDERIFLTYQDLLLRSGAYPLATALCLIFIYPIPARYVYQYWRTRQRELKVIQQKIDDETPLTKEEARQLRREALTVSLEHDKALQGRSAEIARLKEMIQELQNDKIDLQPIEKNLDGDRPAKLSQELDVPQIQMLEKIAKSSNGVLQKRLVGVSDDNVLAEYNLGELVNGEYVSKGLDREHRDYRLKATHKGRAIIVKRQRKLDELNHH